VAVAALLLRLTGDLFALFTQLRNNISTDVERCTRLLVICELLVSEREPMR